MFVTIPKDVQTNTVPKLVETGNVLNHDRAKCSSGFLPKVKMTHSMLNGHEVLVRAGPSMEQVPSVSVLTAESSVPFDASSGSDIFTVLSFSLMSEDEYGVWCTNAKSKMKVGVVSVTVEQHTEGRVQRGVSTFTCRGLGGLFREGRIEIVFRRDEGCGQHLITAIPLVLGSETSLSPQQQMPERCVSRLFSQ